MYIYQITNTVTGDIYIGQTIRTVNARFYHHKYNAKNYMANVYLYNAMRKYGIEKFKVEQIDEAKTKEELNEKERLWISKLSPAYNMTEGGDGGCCRRGHKFTEEHKAKIAAAMRGKKMSSEHKEKLIQSRVKTYQFLDPNGNLVEITNLAKFCKENNLNQSHMVGLHKGRYGVVSHKGWTRSVSVPA